MMSLEIPGVKLGILIAGVAGGVVCLTFVKPLTKLQGVLSVFTGAATSVYLTPIAAKYFSMEGPTENGVAFLVGLVAMNLIPGIIKLSDKFREKPEDFLKKP